MPLTFTTIQHRFRKSHGLSMNEYTLCDMIYHLSTKPSSSVPGWCYMTKTSMGQELGCTKQAVLNMIDRLIIGGFLIKNDETKFLKTTEKWQEVYSFDDGKETLPQVNKLDSLGKETLPESGKETLPYNIYTNKDKDKEPQEPIYESLLDQSFRIFTEAGITGVFFEKMKSLYSLSTVEVKKLHQVWHQENEAKGTVFKTVEHLRNSFNAFIKKSRSGGGRTVMPLESPKKVTGGRLI